MKVQTTDQFILNQEGIIKALFIVLHEIILDVPFTINPGISFGIPFYKNERGKPLCYLNKFKEDSVDISFWYGVRLQSEFQELIVRKRKQIASLNFKDPMDINIERIHKILTEVHKLRK